ncbi:serine hydrolase [Amorphus sp. 3PC139-8]|uniref:serine hydrolase n=1 Tax=Amorphus sp. 3PC139-8 TaxID=2735676 RepID=UPI00345D45E2
MVRFAAALVVGFAFLATAAPSAQANEKYAALVVDGATGKTLFARHADAQRYPASLTKIMTLYIVFEELRAGRLSLDTPIPVSSHAAAEAPSKIGFKAGQTIRVRDAIRAMVTKSANDVATAVAEKIGGNEAAFAKRMTRTARRLGMSNTTYYNAHGLPQSPNNTTTARDQVRLGIAIQQDFPVYYSYFSTRSFTYRGHTHRNHNKLLGKVNGVDGIKTGYIRASGFNLLASVKRDGRFIVAAVFGGRTGRTRDAHMTELINTYLPKATRGGTPVLISRNVPVPDPRPAMPVALALAEPDSVQDSDAARAVAAAVQPGSPIAPPKPEPQQRLTPELIAAYAASVRTAHTTAAGSVDSLEEPEEETSQVAAQSAAVVSGWHVQIAATDSESKARTLLLDAQRKNRNVLGNRDLYTEPVDVDGTTLYRARFTGFNSKSEAWAACSQLKKRKVSCWAIDASS